MALLIFTQELVFARIEEVRMRVERAEHAGDGAFVDGFIGIHVVGEVLFEQAVRAGEGFQAGVDFIAIVAGDGRCCMHLGSEDAANNGTKEDDCKEKEERPPFLGHPGHRP